MEGRPTDGDLFTRAQRGDKVAYEEIVRRYQEVAFRTAYMITGSSADAEDAAQEGFVKAYRALATFRTGAEPRPCCCGSWPTRRATAHVPRAAATSSSCVWRNASARGMRPHPPRRRPWPPTIAADRKS